MGTFGAGPFSSDGAMDFLGELAGHPPAERQAVLRRTFLLVKENPDLLGREFFPDEIVAVAAVVAAALPGGQQFDEELARLEELDLIPNIRLISPLQDLVGHTREALLSVADPWLQGWTTELANAEARDTFATLSQVLAHGCDSPDDLDLIWEEANDYGIEGGVPDGTPPGIEHLTHLMRVYNSAMGGGLYFALEANEPSRVRRAIIALRYFGMAEAATLLDEALNSESHDSVPADVDFYALVDGGPDLLGKAFRAKAVETPDDFNRG
ncbi:putative iron-dependent peroxidase [Actinoplanes sp. SE50]|uniref:DUF4259 domain-containing protein n=1 Tax=unclassified Actinoplanes TaxID=2626549 RepID=UPI00023ED4AD|nr:MULTISPECIES: DUF4259 domain-containing protein [unclassified Actinoplanes]AEV86731.1 hypothetical protein ACPL_5844 [Actinoplanes sp. SE50/110]ATO85128.1 putative iron-dependent peroxidase [Actinoplanes sp. SE50]SLM02539.1 hypothetical protein ACSP50_5789 [Actinoplanes sp. SE50/110]